MLQERELAGMREKRHWTMMRDKEHAGCKNSVSKVRGGKAGL